MLRDYFDHTRAQNNQDSSVNDYDSCSVAQSQWACSLLVDLSMKFPGTFLRVGTSFVCPADYDD